MTVALLLALAAAAAGVLGDRIGPDALVEGNARLREWQSAQGGLAVAVFFAATAAAALVSLPGIGVFTLAAGYLFGPVAGTAIVASAATLGATGIFLLTRAGFGDGIWRRIAEGRAASFAAELRRNEVEALLLLRLAPVVPFLVANVLPALMGVRAGRYVLTTFAGLLPGTLALSLAGAGLGSLASPERAPAAGGLAWLLVGAPLLLVALALAARLLRRR